MQKLFTLVCAAIFSFGLMADEYVIGIDSLQLKDGVYTWSVSSNVAVKKKDVYIEVPTNKVKGSIIFKSGSNAETRFLYIYKEAGTVKDETRKVAMLKAGDTLDFVSSDIMTKEAKPCLHFYTVDDFKFNYVSYVAEEDKEIVSTTETLTAVAIDDEPLSAANLATLIEAGEIILAEPSYLIAPVVKFTKHVVVTYDDSSKKESDETIEKTSTQAAAGMWGAMVTIGEKPYVVYTKKTASCTVTYYDGETKLGEEVVSVNGSAAMYETYSVKPLHTFVNWYTDQALTHEVTSWTITGDISFYGKWEKAYATSLDFENWVLTNGMNNEDGDHIGDVFKDVLTGANYAFADINALDTLNDLDKKENRNYAFLGLKIKKTAGHVDFNLKKGSTLKIRFGNVGNSFVISINGKDSTATDALANKAVTDSKVFEYTATEADALIKIYGCAGNKTLVLKQIKIDDQISPVELPAPSAYALKTTAENGTVAVKVNEDASYDLSKKNVPVGASVELTVTANEGYVIKEVTVNDVPANLTEGKYTFTMPAKEVTVVATFEAEATALDNTNATVKATKVVRNGMLLIEKNGEVYNVLGTRVR